ncbi:hypothetical protein MRX96_043609 [Rhipicephalus microplus]
MSSPFRSLFSGHDVRAHVREKIERGPTRQPASTVHNECPAEELIHVLENILLLNLLHRSKLEKGLSAHIDRSAALREKGRALWHCCTSSFSSVISSVPASEHPRKRKVKCFALNDIVSFRIIDQ